MPELDFKETGITSRPCSTNDLRLFFEQVAYRVIVRKSRPDLCGNDFAMNKRFDEICLFHRSPPSTALRVR
jgi:hypothetical protein